MALVSYGRLRKELENPGWQGLTRAGGRDRDPSDMVSTQHRTMATDCHLSWGSRKVFHVSLRI